MNLYDTNMTYLLSDMLIYTYDFTAIDEAIGEVLEHNPSEIAILLEAITPTPKSFLLERFLADGRLKSYQEKEVCVKIYDLIKGALNANFEDALNRFSKLKNIVKVKIKNSVRKFSISIQIRHVRLVSLNIMLAIIRQFNVDVLGYCDKIEAYIYKTQKKGENSELIFNSTLNPISINKHHNFMQLSDKDDVLNFYSCPEVKEILFKYFFPYGKDPDFRTEITFDTLREETIAQKRRKVLLPDGEYLNLHDAISPYMSHEEFLGIIENNNILGFYPCVRTVMNHEMVTAVIDIDVLGFLRSAFSPEILWKFIIEITEQIILNMTSKFKLPTPLVVFSGSKGVHLLFRISEDCVYADFNYVRYPELYFLPSQKELAKSNASLVHDKFIFIKTLLQAILLYTVENLRFDEIPEIFRTQLGITGVMDLFTLSVFSHNKIGILLDTSSNNSSVHRVFSFHPATGNVTIPILDPETKKIREECRDYAQLYEECRSETILANIQEGKNDLYFQFPPQITHDHIHYLLRPDILLPTVSVLMRFSDRWITERNRWSYSFWIQMYELNNLYQYILAKLVAIEKNDSKIGEIYKELIDIIENANIKTRLQVKEIVNLYFFQNISYKTLKSKLDAFRDMEFFFRFKKDQIIPVSPEQAQIYFDDFRERRFFFRKFTSFFNISVVLLSHYYQNSSTLKKSAKSSLEQFYRSISLLNTEIKSLNDKIAGKTSEIKLQFVQITCLYNVIVKFFREFFQITKDQVIWDL